MLWTDRNGKMHSTTNLLPQTNTDDFIENTKIVAGKTGSLDLWHEMSVMPMMPKDKTLPLWMTSTEGNLMFDSIKPPTSSLLLTLMKTPSSYI